jgi:hypothetical protein
VVAGHFVYYAVPTNSRALSMFLHYVTKDKGGSRVATPDTPSKGSLEMDSRGASVFLAMQPADFRKWLAFECWYWTVAPIRSRGQFSLTF